MHQFGVPTSETYHAKRNAYFEQWAIICSCIDPTTLSHHLNKEASYNTNIK
jgi:hypothetical protein